MRLWNAEQLLGQLVLGADDQLRRGRGSRGAQIGDEITDGEIGLVSHGGDDRNVGAGDHARQAFIVEGEQIFERAAAASDDDHIHMRRDG